MLERHARLAASWGARARAGKGAGAGEGVGVGAVAGNASAILATRSCCSF